MELQVRLKNAYSHLLKSGKVKNWKEFAIFVGYTPSTISSAKNGNPKFLSESLVSNVELRVYGIDHSIPKTDSSNEEPDRMVSERLLKQNFDQIDKLLALNEDLNKRIRELQSKYDSLWQQYSQLLSSITKDN